MPLFEFIGSLLSTLLPERYRRGTPQRGYAIASGIVQGVVCVFVLVFRFLWLAESNDVLLDRERAFDHFVTFGGLYAQANMVAGLADFWLNPLNVFLVYLVFEAVVRSMAAMADGQVIGTLPLYAVSGVHGLWERVAHKRKLGALIPDQVVRGRAGDNFAMKVYSCRPKPHWNPYIAIEYEGARYQMLREESAPAPRRFVYYLRTEPVGRPAVVVDHYHRDAVLQPLPDKWAGTPRTLDGLRSLLQRSPLVPDVLARGAPGGADFDLKIHSCRPKQDWNAQVTIEFENEWYQLFKEERGSKPRPYIYFLRKQSVTPSSINLRRYSVDDVMKARN